MVQYKKERKKIKSKRPKYYGNPLAHLAPMTPIAWEQQQ